MRSDQEPSLPKVGASFRSAIMNAVVGRMGRGASLGLLVVVGGLVAAGSPWGMRQLERTFSKAGPATYQAKFGDVVFRESEGEDYVLLLSDYECSHCRTYFTGPFQEVVEKVDATIVFRNIGMKTKPEIVTSMLTGCAPSEMGRVMISRFFEKDPTRPLTDNLAERVEAVISDVIASADPETHEDVSSCIGAEPSVRALTNGHVETRKDFTIMGTPTLVVNGRSHTGGLTHEKLAKLLAE
jgi:hypothetical protein